MVLNVCVLQNRSSKNANVWAFSKTSDKVIDCDTVVVKSHILSTADSLWHFYTQGHDQSCSADQSTSMVWKKFPREGKVTKVYSVIHSPSNETFLSGLALRYH